MSNDNHNDDGIYGHGNNDTARAKWGRAGPLKSRWYDDHFGDDRGITARESVENRVRALELAVRDDDTERSRPGSRDVERFFDLFDVGATREPQS